MPATKRGIYHNLKESKYAASNIEVAFFFSSKVYRDKFLNGYIEHRQKFSTRFHTLLTSNILNTDCLADIDFYKRVEKRGFRACIKGEEISWRELNLYALGRATKASSLDWSKMQKEKSIGQRRITG